MKDNEKEMEIENTEETDQSKYKGFKQNCGICEEDLESDAENENEKNVGCDICPRWFHLGCTKFVGLSYNEVSNLDFACDFCDD